MALAAKLTETCYQMYAQQKTGLAPEFVRFTNGKMVVGAGHNLLRPETVETIYWLFTTHYYYSLLTAYRLPLTTHYSLLTTFWQVESLFLMWRFTKDPKYREWGWKVFMSFEKHCKVESGGYAGLKNVNLDGSATRNRDDTMQTFWLAETLKYLLLLFSDDDALDLTTHVINTEAHPLQVFTVPGGPHTPHTTSSVSHGSGVLNCRSHLNSSSDPARPR